ncbi:MAG TPA: SGNH hydrolase domain-containing protein, partial [Rhodanobacteraceae bacterium]|nr:SGNH hydrolase domain-containing protein [Rhodanobacteraceae bacterium]
SGTSKVLGRLIHSADRIYLMLPTPQLVFNGALCAEPRGKLYAALSGKAHCTQAVHSAHFDDVIHWLTAAASASPNVRIIDMTDAVCPDTLCRSEMDGMLVFSDHGHMTATFARTLAPDLLATLAPENLPGLAGTERTGASSLAAEAKRAE